MRSRIPNSKKNEHAENRTQKKQRWINLRAAMRKWPECNYGEFYCDQVYDPVKPWVWVDFQFFHSRLKKYYAVAMATCEYNAYNKAEELAWNRAFELYPATEDKNIFVTQPDGTFEFKTSSEDENRTSVFYSLLPSFLSVPRICEPKIVLKDYGKTAIGLWVTVNKESINEHSIREFITFFRSLGEPTTPGWTWKGDSVEVVPQNLNTRYASTEAAQPGTD
jgi:hypothetical protein